MYRRFVKVTSLHIEINDAMFMAGLVLHNVKIKGEIYTSFISMTMFFFLEHCDKGRSCLVDDIPVMEKLDKQRVS